MPSKKDYSIYLIVHNIRSLYNVGSLFRIADAAGIDKIILSGYTGHPPRQGISKVALGSENYIPWWKVKNLSFFINKLKKGGFEIIALELGRARNFSALSRNFPWLY